MWASFEIEVVSLADLSATVDEDSSRLPCCPGRRPTLACSIFALSVPRWLLRFSIAIFPNDGSLLQDPDRPPSWHHGTGAKNFLLKLTKWLSLFPRDQMQPETLRTFWSTGSFPDSRTLKFPVAELQRKKWLNTSSILVAVYTWHHVIKSASSKQVNYHYSYDILG